MAKLLYVVNTTLDGYTEDAAGNFDWGTPVEDYFLFINNLLRSVGTHLYGRRMYDVMSVWESPEAEWPPYMQEFATIWQGAEKVVYSRTLERATTARTRIERSFDPEAVRRLKAAAQTDIIIGGPELAAHAIREGLVDEYQRFVAPIIVGGGKRWLPVDVRFNLQLLDERRFSNGVIYLRYFQRA
jgi:dihydrofolate reductase